jgi:hypothetical protein
MIAMTIMMIAFSSILMIQSSSIQNSIKAKNMNIVSMLARNKMVEFELEWQDKAFSELSKEQGGTFPDPYQDYQWKKQVKEVKFPSLEMVLGGGASNQSEEANSPDETVTRIGRIVTAYLNKAVREVVVTVSWARGKGRQEYSLTTYWVDMNADFSINE